MRRVAAIVLLIAAAAAFAVVALGAGDDGGGSYKVRAIFDNAGFVIPGEDVKVAGVKVGAIDSIDVTDDLKAAVVLDITDKGYQDFRQDAECLVRPQSLIGERFVECELTQARSPGTEPPPALRRIEDGPGEGQYLLPVDRTGKTVDLDLINDIMREPVRQRLSIILSDLGIGVAGRGEDLNDVIRRADPALKEVDEVLKILAGQNKVLSDLAVNSDTILAPLARERRHVSGALDNASKVARATVEKRADLEADIERLPPFLRELKPTMVRLGALSDEMTPVLTDLGEVAPDINRLVLELGPFSKAGIPALESLGDAAETGTPAVKAALPVTRDLRQLAAEARPVGASARRLLESFQRTDGIQRAMDYIFYQVAAINGFDSFGHYLRAGLIVNQCSTYSVQPGFGCSANFPKTASATTASASASGAPRDPVLVRTAQVLAEALGLSKPKPVETKTRESRKTRKARERRAGSKRTPPAAAAPEATPTPAATPTPTPAPQQGNPSQTETLLDYLFGDDG
jgi:phospholipid/cholesterol/gamma-HCH transport system substrate-binding protein